MINKAFQWIEYIYEISNIGLSTLSFETSIFGGKINLRAYSSFNLSEVSKELFWAKKISKKGFVEPF